MCKIIHMPYHTGNPPNGNSEKNTPMKKKKNQAKPGKRKNPHNSTKKKKGKKSNPPSKIKQNIISKSGIHHAQKRRLMEHALHHTKNHLNFMIGKMERGDSFAKSHMSAMNEVGR